LKNKSKDDDDNILSNLHRKHTSVGRPKTFLDEEKLSSSQVTAISDTGTQSFLSFSHCHNNSDDDDDDSSSSNQSSHNTEFISSTIWNKNTNKLLHNISSQTDVVTYAIRSVFSTDNL
jgi:hypothetical protein